MIHGGHGGHGFFSSTEDTDFLVATLEIFGGNLCLDVADARNESSDHRILSTEHTEDTEFLSTEHTLSNHRNLNGCFFGFFARFDIQATTG